MAYETLGMPTIVRPVIHPGIGLAYKIRQEMCENQAKEQLDAVG
jgi:hypothetical protein